jgi:hypothetical protein
MIPSACQPDDHDFGKHRTYYCPCGLTCLRQLRFPPRPCQCGQPLTRLPYRLDDVLVVTRNGDFLGRSFG